MKKFLSILLCFAMLLSLVPLGVSAEDESLTTDTNTLKKFGFDIDESAYDTHALKPGTHAVETQNELVITTSLPTYTIPLTYNRFYEFEKTHTQTANAMTRLVKIGREFEMKPAEDSMSGLIDRVNGTPEYFVTSSFDPNCSGMKSYTAKVYYSGGMIKLAVYPTNSVNSGDVKTTKVSSAFFNSDIKMWLVEGLLSVATGDFDGDGNDEIAVYAPDNSDEYNGADHNELKIKIYSYDTKEREIVEEQSIDLTDMGNTGKTCTWNHSKSSSGKCEYYLLPYLSLTADDVNGDGIDDLMAVMNFSTEFNGIPSSTQYTTAQVLDPTTCWASLLEVYEGRQDGNLVNTVLHKPLVANGSGDNSDYRYVIRHANAVVADVTAEGSKEIVIGGRYTKIEYKNATGTTKVNSTRESYRDSENLVFANILGYASYDTVKAYPVSQEGAPYKWVTKTSTTDTLRHYVYSANNPIQQPVSLCGYKFNGFGHPDRIFIEGQNFEYDVEADTLAFVEEISPSSGKKDSSTNRWYCKATAANACDDKFGTEILAVTYFNKIDSKEEYYAYVVTVQPRREFTGKASNIYNITIDTISNKKIQTVSKTTTTLIDYAIADSKYHVCVSWGDYDDDSTFIRYENGDTDVYYSRVEPLAIMQAPPLYGELNDDTYLGNSETSFAKSRGEGTGSSLGGSLTAGVVAGFEQETSFLGLFKVAGGEFELKVTATASYDKATSTSFDYSTGFATAGTTDSVVIFTVPYVRYNCEMIMPKYQVPTESEYNAKKAFRDELKANIEAYAETNVDQVKGTYAWIVKEYDYMYHSRVSAENYGEQLGVLETVSAEVDAIEKAVAACGKGGDKEWGETVENAVLPYHYCIPQAPLVTTVGVETYDSIADYLGLDKISEKVFNDGYKSGDPNSYAHDIGQLKKGSGTVLEGKNTTISSNEGFLTNSNLSAPGTSQSQTISVSTEEEQTLGWAAGIETTVIANAGGAFGGVTASAEINGSYVWTTTSGNEYSGVVVALPEGTSGDYSYNWKLVAYNGRLNGKDVPVVGYLTRVTATPPPSVAQNISVEDVTDTGATITWEEGTRKADYYTISRVAYDGNENAQYYPLPGTIKSVDGKCSYTLTNLQPSTASVVNTSYYVIESYTTSGKKSVASQRISVTTLPEGFAVVLSIDGVEENVIYRDGKNLVASLNISGNETYNTYYQWEKDSGDGWEKINGETDNVYDFNISGFDDQCKIRCAANVFVGNHSYTVYSNPVTLSCAKTDNGYRVDWEDNKIKITKPENAPDTMAIVRILDSRGNMVDAVMIDGEKDLSEYLGKGYDLRLFILKENLSPASRSFER